MQKNILLFLLSFFVLETIEAQETTQEKLVNQFSETLVYGIKYNDQDTLQSIYPSLQDVKDFLNLYSINDIPEEAWEELKVDRAEDLVSYLKQFEEIKDESRANLFNWKNAILKDVNFEVETETGEVEIEDGKTKEISLKLFFIEILISDNEQTLVISVDEAVIFNKEIKLIEISDWEFRLNQD